MAVVKQFTASMKPGDVLHWAVWGAPYNIYVTWSVRPTLTGFNIGKIRLEPVEVESVIQGGNQQGPLTYHLTITNTGGYPVTIDAYSSLENF